jgi:hypothetical protein
VITLLTPEDIEFMRNTRAEIVANRQSTITLKYADGGDADPITGEIISGGTMEKPTVGVVTEISSQVKIDRYLESGIEVEKGDIWFSVAIEELAGICDTIIEVQYDGKSYEVISKDKKGIGQRNRAEFVGRLIT